MTDIEETKPTIEQLRDELNLKQREFCEMYVSGDREMFGNGTECYIEVYDVDMTKPNARATAAVLASQLLVQTKIFSYINALLETGGFNNENVDKQHLFLINQQADLKTKMVAIKEFNTLKKRIDNKLELVLPKPILELNELLQDNSNNEDNKPEEKN